MEDDDEKHADLNEQNCETCDNLETIHENAERIVNVLMGFYGDDLGDAYETLLIALGQVASISELDPNESDLEYVRGIKESLDEILNENDKSGVN